jgi:MYXO-CTERM domain-containing protein
VTGRDLLGALLGATLLVPRAAAAPCGKPDLLDMIPPNGAQDVPPNARLAAYYQRSAEYLGEEVVIVTPDGNETALPATFNATEGQLSVTPPDLLAPGDYVVRWPVLRSLSSAIPGLGAEAHFTVGTELDEEPPMFEGVSGLRWDYLRETDECTDEVTKRYVFDLELGFASDDGGRNGLTLIVFQTVGPGAANGPVPLHARALPSSAAAQVRVSLVPEDAIGQVCFAALVRDTTGKISSSADREACVETVTPPFFRGCAVAPGDAAGREGLALALLLIAVARRRSRPRTHTSLKTREGAQAQLVRAHRGGRGTLPGSR